MKWGQYDKKNWQQHSEYYLHHSFVHDWLCGKLFSPTAFVRIVYWYTASLSIHVRILYEWYEGCERVFNVYFCTDLRHNKMKMKKNGGGKSTSEKPRTNLCVFMCQSVSNGFLLKWNKHKTPADTCVVQQYTEHKRKVHCMQKKTPHFYMSQTYLLSGAHINRRPFSQTIIIAMKRKPPRPSNNKIINEWEKNML